MRKMQLHSEITIYVNIGQNALFVFTQDYRKHCMFAAGPFQVSTRMRLFKEWRQARNSGVPQHRQGCSPTAYRHGWHGDSDRSYRQLHDCEAGWIFRRTSEDCWSLPDHRQSVSPHLISFCNWHEQTAITSTTHTKDSLWMLPSYLGSRRTNMEKLYEFWDVIIT